MRLNCPACSAVLELNDALMKKLVRCPKCEQSFVVPEIAPPVVAAKSGPKVAAFSDELELSPSEESANAPQPTDTNLLKFCPGCGAPWQKGAFECPKCRYIPSLGAQLKPKPKKRVDLRFDPTKLYLLIFLGALGYGIYWLYGNWNWVRASINSMLSPGG